MTSVLRFSLLISVAGEAVRKEDAVREPKCDVVRRLVLVVHR
jgi:hypothetical protein